MNPPRERRRPLDAAVNPNAETASQQSPVPDAEAAERRERIAVAAYYKAERRGFREGSEHDDWLEAEKEVERQDRNKTRPSRLQDEISSPDHMVPREPLPAGQPHDPLTGKGKAPASKKPERRARAR